MSYLECNECLETFDFDDGYKINDECPKGYCNGILNEQEEDNNDSIMF